MPNNGIAGEAGPRSPGGFGDEFGAGIAFTAYTEYNACVLWNASS
jgi:hypothetical protein